MCFCACVLACVWYNIILKSIDKKRYSGVVCCRTETEISHTINKKSRLVARNGSSSMRMRVKRGIKKGERRTKNKEVKRREIKGNWTKRIRDAGRINLEKHVKDGNRREKKEGKRERRKKHNENTRNKRGDNENYGLERGT